MICPKDIAVQASTSGLPPKVSPKICGLRTDYVSLGLLPANKYAAQGSCRVGLAAWQWDKAAICGLGGAGPQGDIGWSEPISPG